MTDNQALIDESQVSSDELSAILADIAAGDAANKATRNPNWVNPAEIREDDSSYWGDLVTEPTFPRQVLELLKLTVLLPRGDFQVPIAASYLMLPSTFCNKIPIALSQGVSGSGKSTIAHLACAIHSVEPLGSGSTFPAIRNQIKKGRFYDPEIADKESSNERNTVLAWEDINSNSLRAFDGNIFNLLKLGVDRKGKISIAMVGGKNMEFPVFSPKLVSSIHAFYAEHEFRELIRRLVVIEHKRYNLFASSDYSDFYDGIAPDDLMLVSSIDWSGITEEFNNFWMSREIALRFAAARKSLKRPKSIEFPAAYFDMYKDLMATGIVCGYWHSAHDAIEHMAKYCEWHFERIENAATGTEMVLRNFIKQKQDHWEAQFERLKAKGQEDFIDPFRLDASEIKIFLDEKHRNGEIEINPNARERSTVMEALGFRLQTAVDDSKNYWYPVNQ